MKHHLKRRAAGFIVAAAIILGPAMSGLANQSGVQIPTTGPLPGLTLVNDTNAALQTLVTLQSGGAAPTAAGLGLSDLKGVLWHDTNTNQVKIRNQADTAWISFLTIDETGNAATPVLSVTASSSSQTVGTANHPAAFVSLAAATYTLNQTATMPAGSAFSVFAQAGNVTIAINGADKINNGSAGVGMVIPTGYASHFKTDGAGNWWVNTAPASVSSATIASGSTTDIGSLGTSACTISGTTTITGFGSTAQAGQIFFCTASGAFQLTYNATSMILNTGGSNYTTSVGDRLVIKALGSGNFEVTIARKDGAPMTVATPVFAGLFSNLHVYGGCAALTSGFCSTTDNAKVILTADAAVVGDGSGNYSTLTNLNATISTGCTGAVNCFDTGTLPSSAWLYVFAISNGSTKGGLLSTSRTAPTLPTGYTQFARLGAVRLNASSNLLGTIQAGRRVQYIGGGTNVGTLPQLTSGGEGTPSVSGPATLVSISISSFVPPTAARITIWLIAQQQGSSARGVWIAPSTSSAWTSGSQSQTYGAELCGQIQTTNPVGNGFNQPALCEFNLESSNIGIVADTGAVYTGVLGWEDNI